MSAFPPSLTVHGFEAMMADPQYANNRLRVTRACDRCKKRKIRCSGFQPCETCTDGNHPCAYTAPYTRGRRPPRIQKAQRKGEHELVLSHQGSAGTSSDGVVSPELVGTDLAGRLPCRAPVELAPTDIDGHYLGPASEAAFLLRVQRTLNPSESFSHVSLGFSLADNPLSLPDFPLQDTIRQEEAAQLMHVFFDYAMPIGQFVHRSTVESWIAGLGDPSICSQSSPRPRKALLHSMFAIAQQHMDSTLDATNTNPSWRHFATAELHLSQRQPPISLTIVQACLCQCIWLLRESRINQCWELLGVAARHALAIGLHRASCLRQASDYEPLSTFWCLYSLDTYLSIALGRPRIFNDLDIDQDFPHLGEQSVDVEDQPSLSRGCGNAAIPTTVAYFRLSWMIGKVLRDFYSSYPRSVTEQISLATHHLQYVRNWREEFCNTLAPDDLDPGLTDPTLLLLRDFLNLVSSHSTILITRPFLLDKLASSHGTHRSHTTDEEREVNLCIDQCKSAALSIIDILSNVDHADHMVRLFWFTPFIALSAITVLYSYSACKGSALAKLDDNCFSAASRCQILLLSLVREDSLAAKYALLLEDLRSEV
ncbi:fungal-specific transcription factor domain-containing protein [Aspergillus cavernicola]|uniref:Fungal-specific transcription factor domain-containing protein n=1 Tax=Aspergillus cavernicola TaxID=176166 RepID=A0ABR4HDA3_9EURO